MLDLFSFVATVVGWIGVAIVCLFLLVCLIIGLVTVISGWFDGY